MKYVGNAVSSTKTQNPAKTEQFAGDEEALKEMINQLLAEGVISEEKAREMCQRYGLTL